MALNELIVRALPYYACFIAQQLAKADAFTTDELQEASKRQLNEYGDAIYLLEDEEVISRSLAFLEEKNIARYIPDEFGPDIIVRGRNFSENLSLLHSETGSIFEKFDLAGGNRNSWLRAALIKVNARIEQERANSSEGNEKAEDEDVWTPIPLDRSDEEQTRAIEALDSAIEELRGDNGYASANFEEKNYVQEKLTAASKRLKEDTQISWMYLNEFAIKPLGILIQRFGKASIGITADAARAAVVAWLKSKGLSFLDDIFK